MTERIGFIGLGIMGRPMARNLLKAGYSLTVWNRSRPGIEELVEEGAAEASWPREVAERSDVVITMVSDSPDVEQVALGPGGIIEAAQVDGLREAQTIYKVVLPLAWPGIIAASLFVFMMTWIDFLVPLTLLFDPTKMPFTVALYQVVGDPISGTNYGALFAASILGSLPVVLLFLAFQRYFVQGLTAGAVKG